MKTNKMFFYALLATVSVFQSMSPTEYRAKSFSINNRAPASDDNNGAIQLGNIPLERDCHAQPEGDKLKEETKKQLEDKQAVLDSYIELKKENHELKEKLTADSKKEKKEADSKKEKKETDSKEADSSELVTLMTQMTSLFTAQMNYQMQTQMMIMNLLNQSQSQMMPSFGPYSMNFSRNMYGRGYSSFNDQNNLGELNIGLPDYQNQRSYNSNPYSILPPMIRQEIPDYGASLAPSRPQFNGFDFSQNAYSKISGI